MHKIIVSLRNPVDRAFSHFKMDVECNLSRMKKKMLIADAFHERMTDEILFLARAGLLKVNTNTLDSSHAWEQGKGMQAESLSGSAWKFLSEEAKSRASILGYNETSWNFDEKIPLYDAQDLNEEQLHAIDFLDLQSYFPAYYFEKARKQKSLGGRIISSFEWTPLAPAEEAAAFERIRLTQIGRGLYAIQLRQWMKFYPLGSQSLVINFDETGDADIRIARRQFQQILQFLKLPKYEPKDSLFKKHNEAKCSVTMHNETSLMLESLFRPHNRRLGLLLGKDWECAWNSCV